MELTHPERIYWPDAGVTKQALADYCGEVWPRMQPFVADRPLALLRCPGGATEQCFFQKHAWKGHAKSIVTFDDPLDKSDEPLVAVRDLDGLIGLVQAAVLEIHPWQSSLEHLEQPDQIVMDLDPGDGVAWDEVVQAARDVRTRFDKAGLASFVKSSGGKGLHVVAPLTPRAGWEEMRGFAKAMAEAMAEDEPDRFVATVAKAKRTGKILVDYLRNGRNQTAVAPYSTRARPGAPIAMPLSWDELGPNVAPGSFTVLNVGERLKKPDPWADFHKAGVPLKEGAKP